MINESKTVLLLTATKQHLAKVNINNIVVGSGEVSPSTPNRNLGIFLDSHMTLANHINKTGASVFQLSIP